MLGKLDHFNDISLLFSIIINAKQQRNAKKIKMKAIINTNNQHHKNNSRTVPLRTYNKDNHVLCGYMWRP